MKNQKDERLMKILINKRTLKLPEKSALRLYMYSFVYIYSETASSAE
jgi:hypothetical protein